MYRIEIFSPNETSCAFIYNKIRRELKPTKIEIEAPLRLLVFIDGTSLAAVSDVVSDSHIDSKMFAVLVDHYI